MTLSGEVPYQIPATERERLNELRGRIDRLTSKPDRDVAIQRYYGTVLTSVLDVIEGVESAPLRVAETGLLFDETVEVLLNAADTGVTVVSDAMSERRNVRLFSACESMPPVTVKWRGTPTFDAFCDRVEAGRDHERRALTNRLQAVDEMLDQRWGEVNDLAPARRIHDQIKGMVASKMDNVDELTAIALAFVGVCLLDAIEEIFDHDELVNRLNGRVL